LCSQILRTLVLQVLRSQHDLAAYVYENYTKHAHTPSLHHIRKLLLHLLSSASSPHIIIDGLDECHDMDQKAILAELMVLMKSLDGSCKLLISSREETHISKTLRKCPTISLTEKRDKVDADIQDYVRHSLHQLRDNFGGAVVDAIEKTVVKKANGEQNVILVALSTGLTVVGMFLWVRLVLAELEDCRSAHDLEVAANNLPQGLRKA
jgi:hypothetical protein